MDREQTSSEPEWRHKIRMTRATTPTIRRWHLSTGGMSWIHYVRTKIRLKYTVLPVVCILILPVNPTKAVLYKCYAGVSLCKENAHILSILVTLPIGQIRLYVTLIWNSLCFFIVLCSRWWQSRSRDVLRSCRHSGISDRMVPQSAGSGFFLSSFLFFFFPNFGQCLQCDPW